MSGLVFFNFCKRFIIEKSNYLREDVYFAEGLLRFLNGMFYALIFTILILIFKSNELTIIKDYIEILIWIYCIIIIFMLLQFKTVRPHEVTICFTSFGIVKIDLKKTSINQNISKV